MAIDAARAKSLFLAASDIADPAERAAYLERACDGDAELRGRVEDLLRANDAAPLPAAPGATVDSASGQPETNDYGDPTARVGALLAGKYKLIEEIGAGGMGSVFMAQQTEPVKRAVAVKVIKAGMDSRAVLARFEAERQALAMMDHPNIAKVLDAGTTDGGRPFFVMELVKGTPITRYCDDHKLTPRQRLELFVPVCQAIQHAHHKGIIHRDIKPSNVLVAMYDDRAVPKVIDFGVAKAAGQSLTDKTLMTGFGALVGTPEYMSPEQASLNNLDIDTRSDVYSLGVLLYELLTGTTPVDKKSLGQAALLEILRIVREVEAPRPSAKLSTIDTLPSVAANRGTEPARLSRLMKGELDWLVMKALKKDRTRRYETANGLARDIQRYLADEVVEARPPSVGYRVSKFVRRHKGQVIAASLVLAALVAGVIGTTLGMVQAKQSAEAERLARNDAQTEKEQAERARAAEAEQRKVAEAEKKQAVEQKNRAEANERLANERLLALDVRTARNRATECVQRGRVDQAIATLRKAMQMNPKDSVAYSGTALQARGQLEEELWEVAYRLGGLLYNKGQVDEAIAFYRKAIEIQPKYFKVHYQLGLVLYYQGQVDEAIACFRKISESRPRDYTAHIILGEMLLVKGQVDEAIVCLRKAIALVPKDAGARNNLARAERVAAVRDKLPAFRNGSYTPASNAERLGLAEWCRIKKLPHAATRLYAAAFTADPKLADDLGAAHRYNAACCAALAAGQGEDAAKLDDKERTQLRQQACDWLRADLTHRTKQLDRGKPAELVAVQKALRHWQQDTDLAGLRDAAALAKLPAEERAACQRLWGDVAALLTKAQTPAGEDGKR